MIKPYPAGSLGETQGDFVELFDGRIIRGPITDFGDRTITINGNGYAVKQVKSFEYQYRYETRYKKHFIARLIKGKINVYTQIKPGALLLFPNERVAGATDRVTISSSTNYYLQKGDNAEINPFNVKLLEEMISDNKTAVDYLNKYKAHKKSGNKYLDKAIETYNMN